MGYYLYKFISKGRLEASTLVIFTQDQHDNYQQLKDQLDHDYSVTVMGGDTVSVPLVVHSIIPICKQTMWEIHDVVNDKLFRLELIWQMNDLLGIPNPEDKYDDENINDHDLLL